jgi:hypothetical protein
MNNSRNITQKRCDFDESFEIEDEEDEDEDSDSSVNRTLPANADKRAEATDIGVKKYASPDRMNEDIREFLRYIESKRNAEVHLAEYNRTVPKLKTRCKSLSAVERDQLFSVLDNLTETESIELILLIHGLPNSPLIPSLHSLFRSWVIVDSEVTPSSP